MPYSRYTRTATTLLWFSTLGNVSTKVPLGQLISGPVTTVTHHRNGKLWKTLAENVSKKNAYYFFHQNNLIETRTVQSLRCRAVASNFKTRGLATALLSLITATSIMPNWVLINATVRIITTTGPTTKRFVDLRT